MTFGHGQPQPTNRKPYPQTFKHKCAYIRESWFDAFEAMGGFEELTRWGTEKANRKEFYKIMSTLLPKDIKIEGDANEPLRIIYRATRTDLTVKPEAG